MASCKKCSRTTTDCPGCKGGRNTHGIVGRLTCSQCSNTGQVCPEHGRFWK